MQKRFLQFSLLGLVAGFASAFLGIGGGTILVPGLLSMGFDIKKALGSSLAAIVLISAVAAATHFFINAANIDFVVVAVLLVGGALLGAKIGAEIVKRMKSKMLVLLFAIFLVFVALKMIGVISFGAIENSSSASPLNSGLLVVGLFAGIASTMFGIGGGTIYVPMLNIFFGFPMHSAVATSITTVVGTSLFGAFFHRKLQNMDSNAVKAIAPFGLVGAIAGAFATTIIAAPDIKLAFGIFLLLISARLFLKIRK